jgi:phosphatidylglycerophosphate synthase
MRKIISGHENPIDNVLLQIVDKTEKYHRALDLTPNHLTTISLLFGILGAYFFYNNNKKIAIIFLILAYYYDCMDGHYARKYNMTSEFGDYYDHVSDFFKFGLLFYVMHKLNPEKFMKILPFIIIFGLILGVHMGCQEKNSNHTSVQPVLDKLKNMCHNKNWIEFTRFFGCGTQVLAVVLIVAYY